jgi:hypothetical protein
MKSGPQVLRTPSRIIVRDPPTHDHGVYFIWDNTSPHILRTRLPQPTDCIPVSSVAPG